LPRDGATACSDDDQSTAGGALTPSAGAAGASSSAGLGGSAGAAAAGGSGGSVGNGAGDSGGNAGGATGAGAGAKRAAAGAAGEAGAGAVPGLPDAGAEPAAEEPPAEDPPPDEDVVGFSDVYGLLVTQCGQCHSGNPAFLPGFAQPDEAAASALVLPGGLADRIYARAVTDRTMPPDCDAGDFGDPGCVSEEEAALLQAWADGGYQP
jgi:hypothetical protein